MTITAAEVQQVWQEADCLCTEEQMEAVITKVAANITEELADKNPVVLCVMTGGLIFASKLAMQLAFPLQIDYIHVSRYRGEVVGGDIEWMVTPKIELKDRCVLVVDDILDEGQTLHEIIQSCERQGAESVYTAVLVDKQHDRKAIEGLKASFTGMEIEDRYIFGYGMDYKGYLRNAAGIYAVKGL